jgi:predicted AAA+ superfamily ATPase
MKQRKIADQMRTYLVHPTQKIVFLWGPRQVGKSTILEDLQRRFHGPLFTFDDIEDQRLFVPESSKLKALLRFRTDDPSSRYVFIDEIQKHPDATAALKLLVDTMDVTVVATGSSELRAKTRTFDALTGRFTEFFLYPLTIDEYAHFVFDGERLVREVDPAVSQHFAAYLEPYMIYGGYPHIAVTEDKIGELRRMARTSIVKDVVDIYNLRNTSLVYDLLRLLALQIGNLMNITELANTLKTTKPTLLNYLDILVKNHIIRFVEPYKTNARRAVSERRKVYFVDLGIRNALVDDFRSMHLRPDAGAVFENAVVMGALRRSIYAKDYASLYFYREHAGGEIDLVIRDSGGTLAGYEIKWGAGSIALPRHAPVVSVARIGREESIRFLV